MSALPDLLACLASSAPIPERRRALLAVAKIPGEEAQQALLDTLAAPEGLAISAARALARRGEPGAGPALQAGLRREAAVARACAEALARLGEEDALPALATLAEEAEEDETRAAAVRAAAALGDRAVALHGLEDRSARVRADALGALAQGPDAEVLAGLRAGLADLAPEVRSAAVRALARAPSPERRLLLRGTDPDPVLEVERLRACARAVFELPAEAPLRQLCDPLGAGRLEGRWLESLDEGGAVEGWLFRFDGSGEAFDPTLPTPRRFRFGLEGGRLRLDFDGTHLLRWQVRVEPGELCLELAPDPLFGGDAPDEPTEWVYCAR